MPPLDDFSLEKMEINKRLGNVEGTMHSLELKVTELVTSLEMEKRMMTRLVTEIDKAVDRHTKQIFGNGDSGLQGKLTRMEEREKMRTWNIRALWLGIITVVAGIIIDTVGKGR